MKNENYSIECFLTDKNNIKSNKLKKPFLFWLFVISYCLICITFIILSCDKSLSANSYILLGESSICSDSVTASKTSENNSSKTTSSYKPVHSMININTADIEVLSELDGIGEALAQKIIDYRTTNGAFTDIEQLKNVTGIGDKIFSKNEDRLYVDNNGNKFLGTKSTKISNSTTYSSTTDKVKKTTTTTPSETQTTINESSSNLPDVDFPLDLNTVTKEELMCIPNMSDKFAESIISLREKIIYFSAMEELWMADKITAEKYNSILDYVYIDKN